MRHESRTGTPRGTRRTIGVAALLAAALLAPSAAAATPHKVLPAHLKPIESKVLLRGADKNGTLHLVVTLKTPGFGAPRAAGGAAQPFALLGAQISERISARAAVSALGGTVNAEYRHLFNGLRVHIPATQLDALRRNPHVADVQLVTRYNRVSVAGGAVAGRGGALPTNAGAATEVQAKNVWAQTATSKAGTGFGVKVAVIDTGIDYTHDDFVRDGDVTFPTAKVVAGYDLAGDDYAPGAGGIHELPQPDSDPMDCTIEDGGGHGTHVAGTIAGYGIKGDHTYGTSAGEYYKSTTDLSTFTLAPGMAPLASLIAIRVFGCDGATELAADGIEKAVALGANVINLSLGSPYGIQGGAEQAAINAAEKAGVTVVVAAGNEGNKPFLVGSPSTEDGAISVAALDDRATYPGVTLSYPVGGVTTYVGGGTGIGFLNTNVYDLSTPLMKNIYSLKQTADPTSYSLGCPAIGDGGTPYTPDWDSAGAVLTDKVVIIRRGVCTFKEKVDAVTARGAVGVIILQRADIISGGDTSSYPPFQGPDTPTASVPVLMASGAAETALISSLTGDGLEGNNVTLSTRAAGVANPNYHTVAEFSSGGPRWGDLALKPEVAAPGVDIVSAASGSGNGVAWFSGTSMATPVVAGVAALVKQVNPKWTPALIKSALINTAKSVGGEIPLTSVGAGRVNALNAVRSKVTIDAGPNATMSFGMVYGASTAALSKSQTFIVKNSGTSAATYRFSVAAATGFTIPSGVTVKIYDGSRLVTSSTSIVLGAGKSKKLTVKLAATIVAQQNFYYDSLNVVITGTSSGKPTLRLPVYARLQHVETFTFAASGSVSPYDYSWSVTTGTWDGHEINGMPRVGANAWGYVWLARDGRERIANGADIKNVAVQVHDIPEVWGTPAGGGAMEIVISSWDLMSNAAMNEWDIELDTNNDGAVDQVLVLADAGLVNTGYANGTLGCFYIDNLGWDSTPGKIFDLTGGDCSVYADPVSSVVWVSLESSWYWDTAPAGGAHFRVTSYNGAGWDSDSTGASWMYVSFDEVAMEGYFMSDLPLVDGATSGVSSGALPTLGRPSVDGTTPNLGWLFWNQDNGGADSEIYELLVP